MRIQNVVAIVVGMGEIGKALAEYLSITHQVITRDIASNKEYDNILSEKKQRETVLHICIPFKNNFDFCESVKKYQQELRPIVTIIHSTVPVGTSRLLGAVHSPVSGRHPFIEESLNEFTKFVGGDETGFATEYLRKSGFRVYATDRPESTELLKLDCTTWFGVAVEKTRETYELCKKYNVPFELFTIWTADHNRAVTALGQEESVRPNLVNVPGVIGGHCVLPNAAILGHDSDFARFILDRNGGGISEQN